MHLSTINRERSAFKTPAIVLESRSIANDYLDILLPSD